MTRKPRIPTAPTGTGSPGRALWRSVLDEYELEEHEMALLREAVRTVDLLHRLDVLVRKLGPTVASPQGIKSNPAVVEARQQRIALARLIAALRLPAGEDEAGDTRRPQRRVGVRGVYGPRNLRAVE